MNKIIKRLRNFANLFRVKTKIFYYRCISKEIQLIIGAGGVAHRGWIATDIDTLNIIDTNDWRRLFPPSTVSAILAEHVFEHLSFDEASKAFENCFHYLKYSGYMRIAVPDGLNPSKKYIQDVRPGGLGSGAADHKVLYKYTTLVKLLETHGFKVTLLEYFDERSIFRYREWEPEMGLIIRSKRFDPRNQRGEFPYSSLIVDAVKTKMTG